MTVAEIEKRLLPRISWFSQCSQVNLQLGSRGTRWVLTHPVKLGS